MKSLSKRKKFLSASSTDLRTLVESYRYPLLVCDEDGALLFFNGATQSQLGDDDLLGQPIPPDWMDQDCLQLKFEDQDDLTFRFLWEEILWDGNPAWYLVAIPAESETGDVAPTDAPSAEDLRVKLEQSMEIAAVEVEKREQVELDRNRLEAKLRDLHQRSVSKLEAARSVLENEKIEREELTGRLSKLKEETDQLRQQLAEREAADQSRDDDTDIDELRSGLLDAQEDLANAKAANEKLESDLEQADARLERYKRLLEEGEAQEAESGGPEMEALRSRVEELEVELAATAASTRTEASIEGLESECESLRASLSTQENRVGELEVALAAATSASVAAAAAAVSAPSTVTEVDTEETPDDSELVRQLAAAQEIIIELRMRRDAEYQQALSSLRELQTARTESDLSQSSEADEDLKRAEARVHELESALIETTNVADEVHSLRTRNTELEASVEELSSGQASADEVAQHLLTIAALQGELDKSRSEASPEELNLARRRISELESEVAQGRSEPGDSELAQKNADLTAESARLKEQLNELNAELQKVIEGDRETKKLAYADQLTGLPNFNLTGQYLQVCFERSGRGEGALALILLDLDHFRRVNDALGQALGDQLLCEVGARLQQCVTERDTAIARRGEDEFMIVAFLEGAKVDGEALSARIRGIANKLLNELVKPFQISGQTVSVTASFGVALYPGPAQTRDELLEQAEHAMYKAKEAGRSRVSFYAEDMHRARQLRRNLELELRNALNHGQFGLMYQPIVEIPSGKILGVESLLRWSHPSRGMLEPADFLEVAEESGVILEIGDAVLAEALQVAKQKFMKRRFITINLSHRQLIDAGFPARFMKQLQVHGIPPHEVLVEVSEAVTRLDPDRVKNTLAHLAHWGVGVVLDEFGGGRSDLQYLVEFPLKFVKISESLVERIPGDMQSTKVCMALVHMAKALGIPVLAEGIETREQLEAVLEFGCTLAQGRFLKEPMGVNQLVQSM